MAMRILLLNDLHDPRIGSSVRLCYQLARQFASAGHVAEIVSTSEKAADSGPTEIEGVRVHRLHSSYNPRWRSWVSLDNPRVREPLVRIYREFRPDIVHAHLIHTHLSYAALTEARAAGAAVLFTAHDVMTFCHQKLTCFHGGAAHGGALRDYRAYWQKCLPCQRLRWNPWRNRAIRRVLERDVQRISAVSHELARALGENGIRVDRVLHNALELQARPVSTAAVERFRRERGLEGMQLIAMGGRLHEQKGVFQLLEMLHGLAPRFPQLRLMVLGKRDVYEREFAMRARELGVAERIVATGWLEGEELQAALEAVDVFVTPSICFDTFGMVNLEAMEHAKPVVATVFGGSPEVVEDGVSGLIRTPFDLEGFSRAIGDLLNDPARAREMGRAGQVRLAQSFRIERLAAECLEEYRRAQAP
jgi:glycosyltransferase involved in cell wall biosynthesis